MTWYRKPDGRPMASITVDGKRRRVSILPAAYTGRAADLTDAQCQALYDAFIASQAAQALEPPKPKPRPIHRAQAIPAKKGPLALADIRDFYIDVALPARGAALSTVMGTRKAWAIALPILAANGVKTADDLRRAPYVLDALAVELANRYKPASANYFIARLAVAIRHANDVGLIPDPLVKKWPKLKEPKPHFPDRPAPEALAVYLDSLRNTPFGDAVHLLWLTGLRPVDVAQLRWDRVFDLDTPAAYIHIVQRKTNAYVTVPLSPDAADIIRRRRLRRGPLKPPRKNARPATYDPAYVFGGVQQRQMRASSDTAARAAGLPHLTLVDARRWVVSALIDAGKSGDIIGLVTGHKSHVYLTYYREKTGARHDLAAIIQESLKIPTPTTHNVTPLPKPKTSNTKKSAK